MKSSAGRLECEAKLKDGFILEQQAARGVGAGVGGVSSGRQASGRPFLQGRSQGEAATSGRKSGGAHGRHGHRPTPLGSVDRELDAGPARVVRGLRQGGP